MLGYTSGKHLNGGYRLNFKKLTPSVSLMTADIYDAHQRFTFENNVTSSVISSVIGFLEKNNLEFQVLLGSNIKGNM